MSDPNQKLQRLLAQQRAIAAQIKSIEHRERERDEKAISLMIRRYKLTRFKTEELDRVFTRVVADLESNATSGQIQSLEGMGQTNAGWLETHYPPHRGGVENFAFEGDP